MQDVSWARPVLVASLLAWSAACAGGAKEPRTPARSRAPVPARAEGQVEAPAPAEGEPRLSEHAEDPAFGGPEATDRRSARGPLDPQPLDGPFAELSDYLVEHPIHHDESCPPLPKPTSPPRSLAQKGAIREARLMRAPGSFACAVVEYCLIGLRTQDGWYVRKAERPCHGTVGPGQRIETPEQKSRWVITDGGAVLALEEARALSQTEVHERAGAQSESTHERQSRYLVLCGVGPSGVPSCTDAVVLSCPKVDGETSRVEWSLSGEALELKSEADPASACDFDEPFVVGTYPLGFP